MKNIVLLLGLILFTGCYSHHKKTEETSSLSTSKKDQQILYDVKYGKNERNVMDIYLPENRNINTPFVVNIHGGAWTLGDKNFDTKLSEYLFSKGIAVANINYRYANDNDIHLPELLSDVDAVFNYLIEHSKEWNTRDTGFSIGGESSGAHMSLMYAYTGKKYIKAIVERCGPTDFTDTQTLLQLSNNAHLIAAVNKMTGNKITWKAENPVPESYKPASPVNFVKKIPILILHGDKDDVVPIRQSYNLIDRLKEKNYPYQLIVFPGADHSLDALPGNQLKKFSTAANWFNEYGKN
ncbi:prolyl oligopeptidase family serine peptidase [Epilithonimonas sp.]|uniref:prolyl oligopeptidase family serine peptidase n=1 Tax=Epilithonimonas sp. TaxID=2894511 RepID=UPI0035AF7017